MIEHKEMKRGLTRSSPIAVLGACSFVGVAALVLILGGWPARAMAQKARRSSEQTSNQAVGKNPDIGRSSAVLVSPDEDYRIGVGDLIDVQVEDMPEASRSIRVTAAGTFLMPILGRMKAQGKTPEALAQEIANRLRGDYLKDPKVSVVVRDYNSRSFFIQGAVRNPGVFQVEGRPSILTVITLAGGLADNHGAVAFIIRRTKQQQPMGLDLNKGLDLSKGQVESTPGPSSPADQTVPSSVDGASASGADDEEQKYELLR